jgi:DNA topoisomerase-1
MTWANGYKKAVADRARAAGTKAAPDDDPAVSAQEAGLRYVSDSRPGIQRRRAGRGFTYLGPDGKRITDQATLDRIKSLAVPPAWEDVWICPDPRGHLQATGRDSRGRKQYRYHPRWREVRDSNKFDRLVAFGLTLPKIRKRTEKDLARPGLPREKVLAAVIRLLESTLIRVGNEEYARENRSFGLTTLKDRHVEVNGSEVEFRFRGKGGAEHRTGVNDRRLAAIVKRCQDLPGQQLFLYVDEDGEVRDVDSNDVNEYLRQITGQDITAKDFRTWAGTVAAAWALEEFEEFDSEAQAKRNIVRAIEQVAKRLGNTPAVCRAAYIHPTVFDAYTEGIMLETLRKRASTMSDDFSGLEPEEAAVLALLQHRLSREARGRGVA